MDRPSRPPDGCFCFRSLADTEARKNPAQEVLAGKFAGDFVQSLLRDSEFLGDELARAPFLELAGGLIRVAAGAGQRIEMALAGRDCTAIECLIAHTHFQVRAQALEPFARKGG